MNHGEQAAIEAVAKAKALEMQRRKAQGHAPMQAASASGFSRLTALGIWIAAIASLVGVFYAN